MNEKSLVLNIDGRRHIIRKIFNYTKDTFEAYYKGYDINISLDDDGYYGILVNNPEVLFGTAYDGYAPDGTYTMEDAIIEALRGSQLINK